MGKKKGGGIVNKDVFSRLNYLYQAAHLVQGLQTTEPTNGESSTLHHQSNAHLTRFYVSQMLRLAKSSVSRMSLFLLKFSSFDLKFQ
jgi:RNase P subunit RPR2